MREIKFRAWFEDEMIFSDCPTGEFEFVFDDSGSMEFNAWNDEKHKLTPDGDVTYAGWDTYTTDIMQYTGLKDKNGKEIYEDDIVKDCFIHIDPDNLDDGYLDGVGKGTIVWYKCGFWIRVENQLKPNWPRHHQIISEWIEVIGNIHENPELAGES